MICNPIGHEYIRSHGALRTLALNLSSQGTHVLRFDYYATGDSGGASAEASVSQWLADIDRACHQLKDISGCDSVSIVGLRFGALLAVYASRNTAVSKLMLIDPVTNGEAYLTQLKAMQRIILEDLMSDKMNDQGGSSCDEEFVGHAFPSGLQEAISELDVGKLNLDRVGGMDVFQGDAGTDTDYEKLGCPVKLHSLEPEVDWNGIEVIEDKAIMVNTINRVVESF